MPSHNPGLHKTDGAAATGKNSMLKEICEQPEVARRMIEECMDGTGKVTIPGFSLEPEQIRQISNISIIGRGSSRHAGMVAEFMLERLTRLPVKVDFASQYCYRDPLASPAELAIFISQSGTTADTLAALCEARRKGAKSVAICNVADTPIARQADAILLTHAENERPTAATSSFTGQLIALLLLSIHLEQVRCTASNGNLPAWRMLRLLPELMEAVCCLNKTWREYAARFSQYSDFVFTGRDIDYPIALEGAMKLQDICHIHATAYPVGELKHGPMALIDSRVPMVVLATCDKADEKSVLRYHKSVSLIREFVAKSIPVLAVITEGDREIPTVTSHVVSVPAVPVLLQPILEIIPLQLLVYHIAALGGRNADHPRNISKSVMVE